MPVTTEDGRTFVSVVVDRSRPFATALLAKWTEKDGVKREHWLEWRSFSVPAEIYDEIAPQVREALAARKRA